MDLRLRKKHLGRLLAALIALVVLLSVYVLPVCASPDMGRQTPPVEGDIDDCPFCPDPQDGDDETCAVIQNGSQLGWPEGCAPGQEAPHTTQAAAMPRTVAVC